MVAKRGATGLRRMELQCREGGNMNCMLNKYIMVSLLLCAGFGCYFGQGNVDLYDPSLYGTLSVSERTDFFLNDIIDSHFASPPPKKICKCLGNSISKSELTRLYGNLHSEVYAWLDQTVAENDKSKVLFYRIEVFDDKTSKEPIVVVLMCLKEGIRATGPVFFDSIFIDMDIKDYTCGDGGVWDM